MKMKSDLLKFLPSPLVLRLEEFLVKLAIQRTLKERGYFLSSGQSRTKEFEKWFSKELGNAAVFGVNSGTDALLLSLRALGVGTGDEVIVPAFSFISTASCVLWVGAVPVFVDIRLNDYALDPKAVEKKITKRTKAVILAHLYGQPASGTEEILSLAKRHNLFLIEDVAQAPLSEVKIDGAWRKTGTVGDAGCFSFAANKILGSVGNSGAIAIKEDGRAVIADLMRLYGARRHYWEYPVAGLNNKMQEIQASALLVKTDFLNYWLDRRSMIAEIYNQNLKGIDGVVLPENIPNTRRVWYRYVIRASARNGLFGALKKKAGHKPHLLPSINYPIALPYLGVFQAYRNPRENFPCAEQAASTVISLPMNHAVTIKEAEDICRHINYFLGSL